MNQLELCRKIGEFYLQKNNGDYDKTATEITALGFTKIEVANETAHITVARIGSFIGKRGQNIDALSKFLGIKIKTFEETHYLPDLIIPIKYDDYDHWNDYPAYPNYENDSD